MLYLLKLKLRSALNRVEIFVATIFAILAAFIVATAIKAIAFAIVAKVIAPTAAALVAPAGICVTCSAGLAFGPRPGLRISYAALGLRP